MATKLRVCPLGHITVAKKSLRPLHATRRCRQKEWEGCPSSEVVGCKAPRSRQTVFQCNVLPVIWPAEFQGVYPERCHLRAYSDFIFATEALLQNLWGEFSFCRVLPWRRYCCEIIWYVGMVVLRRNLEETVKERGPCKPRRTQNTISAQHLSIRYEY